MKKYIISEYNISGVYMKKRIICAVIALVLLITAFVLRMFRYYPNAADTYAQQGIKGVITKEINNILATELTNCELKYNQISNIIYSNDGQITSLTINTAEMNIIANRLSEKIFDSITNSTHKFGIPLGNALGSRLFSGKGPKIETEIIPIGSVEYEIRSELSDAGINQTLHRICIDFNTGINCLSPFYETEINIQTSIIIAETLIVGKVPEIMLSPRG